MLPRKTQRNKTNMNMILAFLNRQGSVLILQAARMEFFENRKLERRPNDSRPGRFGLVALGLLCGLFCVLSAQAELHVEQVQRDFQARYHVITGNYIQWPSCSRGQSPAPAFPKDGFYGDLT